MSTAGTLQVSGERTSGASIRSQNGERSLWAVRAQSFSAEKISCGVANYVCVCEMCG